MWWYSAHGKVLVMDYRMRYHLTRNRNLPFEVLRVLTDNTYLWAYNYTTPPAVLEELACDVSCWATRFGVVWNPNTTAEVLEKLSADSDSRVRQAASGRKYMNSQSTV